MNRKTLSIVYSFALFFLLLTQELFADDIKKIALLPFQIYSKANSRYLQDAIYNSLDSRLRKIKNIQVVDREHLTGILTDKSVDDSLALAVGKITGATFVITGSVTELGDIISADVRILDVKTGGFLPVIFAQGKGSDSIDNIASQLHGDILIRLGAEQRIARIEFKGNRRIESGAINQVIKSATGSVYSDANLSHDIKSIYKMGYFTDVSAEATDSPEGKIITFLVQEKGIIASILIKGNKAISKDDIEAALTVKVKQTLNLERVKADVSKIKDLYDNKGYYNAEVKDVIEGGGEKDTHVIFNIVENERHYIRNINFPGHEAYTEGELRKLMETEEKGFFAFFTDSGIMKKDQLKQDVEKINAFYLNHGFIYAQVGEPEIIHDKKGIHIKIPITEGKQYRVGKVDIEGDNLKVTRPELLKKLEIKNKRYYAREAVIKDMDFLQQACSDEGYAYADVVPKTAPNDKEKTVDIIYQISKGQQVYFNRINITGNNKTRDKVIRRLLTVVEGELYSKSKLKQSYMELNRLRYFEEVDFQSEKGSDETLTDVNIRIKEKPTGMFSIGAGYSALDKIIFTAQVSQQNLFGRGQTLNLKMDLGARTTNYELSFIEPWLFDIPLWSKFDIWNMARQYDAYDLNSMGGGFTFGYPLWEHVTGYFGYKLSANDVSDVFYTASTYIKRQVGKTTTSTLTLSLTRDTTDDNIFPTRGSKNSFSTEYTGGILQGNASFIKYQASSSWFFPLPLDLVFGVRGRAGYLQETEGRDAPIYERFYLGGMNSLRGLRSVGPKDPSTGDVIGGMTMLNFNAEILFPLIKSAGMKGVIFYDTGNSWESGFYLKDIRKTAGAGIRWYSPIGPLRLEWGHVLDKKADESKSRWEFSIGMFM